MWRWFGMSIVLWNLNSDCTSSLLLLWQLPLRDFAVLTGRSRSVWKEINPWWVAEEGEMRRLSVGLWRSLEAPHEHDRKSEVTWSPARRLAAPTWKLIRLLDARFSLEALLETISGCYAAKQQNVPAILFSANTSTSLFINFKAALISIWILTMQ